MVLKGGSDLVANTPSSLAKICCDEKELWARVIREKNIKG
jgi:hypothetical protein